MYFVRSQKLSVKSILTYAIDSTHHAPLVTGLAHLQLACIRRSEDWGDVQSLPPVWAVGIGGYC